MLFRCGEQSSSIVVFNGRVFGGDVWFVSGVRVKNLVFGGRVFGGVV